MFLKVRPLISLALVATALWVSVNLYAAGSFEFSEGEDEITNVLHAMRIADFYREPVSLGSLLVQERPPLSYLFAVPFLWVLPVNEFTLRLPHALFGILQLPIVFGIANALFGKRGP